MEEQAQSLIDKTRFHITFASASKTHIHLDVCVISFYTCSFSWSSTTRYDASSPYGWTSNDANDGPTSSRNDASWSCSRDEAAHGRTHANDARASNDETSLQANDGASEARDDPSRKIEIEVELHFPLFLFYVLLHQNIMVLHLQDFISKRCDDKTCCPFKLQKV
ncbi:hypothetical protein KIL84_006932 [Mauremys mutica]|uniref:Uncharacterized protein n=1 Tax=Mauremys mutica TaxID=74926 RepID=A0A9D4AV22_9SAUR|nr:hypothetical protein KIL84_006932 [Mauremys mutica]